MLNANKSIAQHRSVLQRFSREGRVKVAEIGGNKDVSFEQALSNLAHAYLKEKAPSLLDYEIGFQLVDRNQENTKAIGAFGFKVGNQWLLGPVFFLNGDLKGHELLYLKNQDLFVPMKEDWLNYILNKKPHILGQDITRDSARAGVIPPNLYQLSRSPYKFASAPILPNWLKQSLPALAHAALSSVKTNTKYAGMADIPTFIKKEGKAAAIKALTMFKCFPKLAAKFNEFYGMDSFKDIVDTVNTREKQANSNTIFNQSVNRLTSVIAETPKEDLLKISVYSNVEKPVGDEFHTLSDNERTTLMREGVHIKDKRMDVSKIYNVQAELKLTNPTETGIYEVLVKTGQFEKCLVVLAPHAACGRKHFATVVRLDGKKNWLNIHPSYIWIKSQMKLEEYRDWYDKLQDAEELSSDKSGLYIIIGPYGQGTCPFKAEKSLGDATGIQTFDVDFKTHALRSRPDHLHEQHIREGPFDYYDHSDGSRIVLTNRPSRFSVHRGEVHIPSGCKLVKVVDFPKSKYDDNEYSEYSSEVPAIEPGNLEDVELMLMQKTAAMKIYHTGSEVAINGKMMSPLQGLIHLVKDHGLREKSARLALKEAELKKSARFRVKYADEYYDLSKSGPSAPPWPETPTGWDPISGGRANTKTVLEQNIPIPGMSANQTERSIYQPNVNLQPYADMQVQHAAQQAAQTGQREIFDTSMLASLIKVTRDDSMVDRWLPDLMKGMDRLGRILMIFYWHQEAFAERYGKSELSEIEDSLRNAFEAIGDIILTLRQKSVDPYPDEIAGVDLSAVADM